jgi:site-specific DNA-methyltransferase (adenine-specific)
MIELNKIYCENCLDTMSRMPDNFIDLTVTSPPYDNLRNYNGYEFDFENIARELYRVTKQGGVLVWVVGDATIDGSETGTSFKQALFFKECGFRLHDTMIYQKQNYVPLTHNRYEQEFEYMFVLAKGKLNAFNPQYIKCETEGAYNLRRKGYKIDGASMRRRDEITVTKTEKYRPNIWMYSVGDLRLEHPAPFPENLARDHIYTWSNEGDLIYDPFSGSGTTAKMAHLLKRNWIGSEISQEYVDLANKRLFQYVNQLMMF